MPINVTNEQADTLTREFARLENVSITDAIVIAVREAIDHAAGRAPQPAMNPQQALPPVRRGWPDDTAASYRAGGH